MTLSIAEDWGVVDGLQTITYKSKTAEGTWGSASIPNVLQRVTMMTFEGDNMLRTAVATFHLWNSQTNLVPKLGDKLTAADGSLWAVKEVSNEALDTRYKLTCHLLQ